MLDSRSFASFPADPRAVTVRTAACELESRDSRPAELTHLLLEEIRTGMMLTEYELSPLPAPPRRNAASPPDLDAVSVYTSLFAVVVIVVVVTACGLSLNGRRRFHERPPRRRLTHRQHFS